MFPEYSFACCEANFSCYININKIFLADIACLQHMVIQGLKYLDLRFIICKLCQA